MANFLEVPLLRWGHEGGAEAFHWIHIMQMSFLTATFIYPCFLIFRKRPLVEELLLRPFAEAEERSKKQISYQVAAMSSATRTPSKGALANTAVPSSIETSSTPLLSSSSFSPASASSPMITSSAAFGPPPTPPVLEEDSVTRRMASAETPPRRADEDQGHLHESHQVHAGGYQELSATAADDDRWASAGGTELLGWWDGGASGWMNGGADGWGELMGRLETAITSDDLLVRILLKAKLKDTVLQCLQHCFAVAINHHHHYHYHYHYHYHHHHHHHHSLVSFSFLFHCSCL